MKIIFAGLFSLFLAAGAGRLAGRDETPDAAAARADTGESAAEPAGGIAEYKGPTLTAVDREIAMKGSRTGQFFVEKSLRFQAGEFVYRRGYAKEDGAVVYNSSSRLGFRLTGGHAGGIAFNFADALAWPAADSCWLAPGTDGASVAQLTVPVIRKNGERAGSYSLRFLETPARPGWLFMRFRFDGVVPRGASWNFDGGWTEFDPKFSRKPGAVRWLYFDGKAVPGSDPETSIDVAGNRFAFGLYAVGTQKFDNTSTVILARLPEKSPATLVFRHRQLFRLNWRVPRDGRELNFAILNRKDRAGKEWIEEFFASGADLDAAPAELDWEPRPPAAALAELSEGERAKLDELFAARDYDAFFNRLDELRSTRDKEIAEEVNTLLD